jgi:hypothetical protein
MNRNINTQVPGTFMAPLMRNVAPLMSSFSRQGEPPTVLLQADVSLDSKPSMKIGASR